MPSPTVRLRLLWRRRTAEPDGSDGGRRLPGRRPHHTASEIKGDLVAAGGEVSLGGGIGDDLYAAGGKVQVDAIVAGNARVAGGEVAIGPATVVNGSVTMSGGRSSFEGTPAATCRRPAAGVRIEGTVDSDAEVDAEEVEIGPETRIAGKLIVRSPRQPTIPKERRSPAASSIHEADVSQHFTGAKGHLTSRPSRTA